MTMPLYRLVTNRFLSAVENVALGLHLSEYHTGYRAYSRRLLERIPFLRNSNDFLFDTQIIFQAALFGLQITEVPIETRYFEGPPPSNSFPVSVTGWAHWASP